MASLPQNAGNMEFLEPLGFTIAEKKRKTGIQSNCCSLKLKT